MASSALNIIIAAADDQINNTWFCLSHPDKASNTTISYSSIKKKKKKKWMYKRMWNYKN